MKDALQATLGSMPAGLLRSLTWDRGKELSAHAQFTIDTGISVFSIYHYKREWSRLKAEGAEFPAERPRCATVLPNARRCRNSPVPGGTHCRKHGGETK